MILAQTCFHCGATSEPQLIQVATVVNICCGQCGKHIRYSNVSDMPPVDTITMAIIQVSGQDYNFIDRIVKANNIRCNVPPHSWQLYWRIYRGLLISKKIF